VFGQNRGFQKKTPKYTWLCVEISLVCKFYRPGQKLKDVASIVACTQKKFCLGGADFL